MKIAQKSYFEYDTGMEPAKLELAVVTEEVKKSATSSLERHNKMVPPTLRLCRLQEKMN